MNFLYQENYGELAGLVSTAGSLIAAAGAIALGWRRRANWEPSEEDIARGPQRVGSLVAGVAIAILWSQTRNTEQLPFLNRLAISLAIATVLSLLVYGFLVSTLTYDKVVARGKRMINTQKIVGGFRLTPVAKQKIRDKSQSGETLTVQDLLKGAAYDPDKVWTRESRAFAKMSFVLGYLGLTVCGTIALATAAIILGLSQQP
jgi:hypothetical protein